MNTQPGEPSFSYSVAGREQTGRACPYCRFPLKEGVAITVCGVCHAAHHSDCWHDNSGCAVTGCTGGPIPTTAERATEASAAPTVVHPAPSSPPYAQPGVPPVPPPWQPQALAPSGGRGGPGLATAIILLALAIGGAAVAIVLSRQDNAKAPLASNANAAQTPGTPTPSEAVSESGSTETSSEPDNTGTSSQPPNNGELPGGSSQQLAAEIQPMLLVWHEDVVHDNYHAAWELLSHRKQVQDENEYGYATWVKNQSTLNPYLNPSGLQVSVEKTEPSEGVAQVDVTGMAWSKPGAPCTEWSGITWVKYEDGAWKYDPGYSTTPQREREWKPRYSELLGGRC
jgi:hypothetical protein